MCPVVAAVIAQAPAANWRANNCGAIVVLPCGARSTPADAQNAARPWMFWLSAVSRSTITGVMKPPPNRLGRRPARSAAVTGVTAPKPFSQMLTGRARSAVTAARKVPLTVPSLTFGFFKGFTSAAAVTTCTAARAGPLGLPSLVGLEQPSQARERFFQDGQALVEQVLGDDQRRQEAQHVAERAAGQHDQAGRVAGGGDPGGGGRIGPQRARLGQLDREHRAPAPHVGDDRVL